jgi:hypothetical protein
LSGGSDAHGINPGMFHQWQEAFFENGAKALENPGPGRRANDAERRFPDLEQRLLRKREAISELMEEHIRQKGELGET